VAAQWLGMTFETRGFGQVTGLSIAGFYGYANSKYSGPDAADETSGPNSTPSPLHPAHSSLDPLADAISLPLLCYWSLEMRDRNVFEPSMAAVEFRA
jgi:hypothetical protein